MGKPAGRLGTHKLPSKYVSVKTRQPQAGVGPTEYIDVLQHLIADGNRLFQHTNLLSNLLSKSWQLEQDNAPSHKTKDNMQRIAFDVPGGIFWISPQPHQICLQLRTCGTASGRQGWHQGHYRIASKADSN